MAVTIGIGGLLVSGASTVKTMNDASDAKAQQKKDNEAAAAQQKKLEAEANQKLKDQQTIESATATRDATRGRQRGISQAGGGRSSTILTGPLGITDTAGPGAAPLKTSLGT